MECTATSRITATETRQSLWQVRDKVQQDDPTDLAKKLEKQRERQKRKVEFQAGSRSEVKSSKTSPETCIMKRGTTPPRLVNTLEIDLGKLKLAYFISAEIQTWHF